jgi:hypothetical protein
MILARTSFIVGIPLIIVVGVIWGHNLPEFKLKPAAVLRGSVKVKCKIGQIGHFPAENAPEHLSRTECDFDRVHAPEKTLIGSTN